MRAILTYHWVDDSGSVLSIDAETFRSHVAWLASGRVRVLSLAEIAERPRAVDDVDAVALTFDDGFENFATQAWPILRDHGLPVTVFVVTDRVGGENAWEPPDGFPRRPLMDWSLLGRLHGEGVDVGSHSRTHESMLALDDARLRDEIHGSSELIRTELGTAPRAFAYPYGDHDVRTVASVAGSYRYACTTEMQTLGAHESPHALPRLDAYYLRRPGVIESWGSMGFAARLRVCAAARHLRRRFEPRRARRG
jgi:peptidoglycan/xylan/chitin deacetylase (PgdA/CDA1 family)